MDNFSVNKAITKLQVVIVIAIIIIASVSGVVYFVLQTTQSSTNPPIIITSNSSYVVVDTGQVQCYDNAEQIEFPELGELFYGHYIQNKEYPLFPRGCKRS